MPARVQQPRSERLLDILRVLRCWHWENGETGWTTAAEIFGKLGISANDGVKDLAYCVENSLVKCQPRTYWQRKYYVKALDDDQAMDVRRVDALRVSSAPGASGAGSGEEAGGDDETLRVASDEEDEARCGLVRCFQPDECLLTCTHIFFFECRAPAIPRGWEHSLSTT